MNAPDIERQLRREAELGRKEVPYETHVTPNVVRTSAGDYLQVFKLQGATFDSADDVDLNHWHNTLCNFWRSNSFYDPRVSIWTHLVRRAESDYPDGDYEEGFAKEFNERYKERVVGELLMVNELYITIVFRPMALAVGRSLFKKVTSERQAREETKSAIEFMDSRSIEILSSLRRFDPERLGVYEHNGHVFSEVYEFLAYLVNGEKQRMPVHRRRAGDYLVTGRPLFGTETIEVRQPVGGYYGAMLGFKTYPNETAVGCLDALLAAPFEFVLTQSFTYMSKATAKYSVKVGRNQMMNTDDDAKSQIVELDLLLDNLESRRVAMGKHHISLMVKAYTPKDLELNVADATPLLGDCGAVVSREDLACEAAFWAQLPGNFLMRPRLSAITSRNFAALAALHNYPSGRRDKNHWGEAVTMLVSGANTPLYFNFHASDPDDPDGGSKKDVGHTLILGPTGSGKTVFVTAMQAFLKKFRPSYVAFTKDNDQELLIRQLGGRYRSLRQGFPTGCNPFQLPPTSENVLFWNKLVSKLVTRPLVLRDETQITEALDWLKKLPQAERRLGKLLDYLDRGTEDSVYFYIRKWCRARRPGEEDGLYWWVFDNDTDEVIDMMEGEEVIVGFDVTQFLDDPTVRTPMNMYLFHLVNKLIDGRRLTLWIAEFWKALGDDAFAEFAKDGLKTMRKKNGFVVLDSQSPADAILHPIARTLIEQTATKILFPNNQATRDDYVTHLKCSEREFKLLSEEINEGSRQFLIKQGSNSVVAKLDLKGFDDDLAILSTTPSNVALVDQIRVEVGEDPTTWLPIFLERRKNA